MSGKVADAKVMPINVTKLKHAERLRLALLVCHTSQGCVPSIFQFCRASVDTRKLFLSCQSLITAPSVPWIEPYTIKTDAFNY